MVDALGDSIKDKENESVQGASLITTDRETLHDFDCLPHFELQRFLSAVQSLLGSQ